MACEQCKHLLDRKDLPHVVRTCQHCGRVMYLHEPGLHGRGFKVDKGDQFAIPAGWLTISPSPLRSRGQFSRTGLDWFAKQVFIGPIIKQKDSFVEGLNALGDEFEQLLRKSPLLAEFDLDRAEDVAKVADLLQKRDDTQEFWALASNVLLDITKDAICDQDATMAAWAAAAMERSRSMLLYKQYYEEVIWMGQSAKRLIDILDLWATHQNDSDEEFWQLTFSENSFVLAQVFSIPVAFIEGKAYIGGMSVAQKDARLIDFLFANEASREAVLIEIKAPTAKLIGSRYRKTFQPSAELTGAVVQALRYRVQLMHSIDYLDKGNSDFLASAPKCMVLIGNSSAELDVPEKRKAFELFRNSFKDIEIVTYDELFRKIEALAALFHLSRRSDEPTL